MYSVEELATAVDRIAMFPKEKVWSEFWLYLGNLIDHFNGYSLTDEERYKLIEKEPKCYPSFEDWQYAFIAGAVQKMCAPLLFYSPPWVYKDKYFLKEPHFSLNSKGGLQAILLFESPKEFRMRNVFTSANTLDRC